MLYDACDSLAKPQLIVTLMCRYIKENADRHEYGELGAWYIYISDQAAVRPSFLRTVHHEMAS